MMIGVGTATCAEYWLSSTCLISGLLPIRLFKFVYTGEVNLERSQLQLFLQVRLHGWALGAAVLEADSPSSPISSYLLFCVCIYLFASKSGSGEMICNRIVLFTQKGEEPLKVPSLFLLAVSEIETEGKWYLASPLS